MTLVKGALQSFFSRKATLSRGLHGDLFGCILHAVSMSMSISTHRKTHACAPWCACQVATITGYFTNLNTLHIIYIYKDFFHPYISAEEGDTIFFKFLSK